MTTTLTPDEQELAVALLIDARRFQNQTVVDHYEMGRWRAWVDNFLKGKPGDDPAERYDTPDRVEHRRFVSRLFRPERRR